ncbi:MAG: undecaprenyl-diphosphate phosphatase [Candidatus Bathyarchaeota archaeon]|nr:undecaprenyl-diphosphate phosphatase [Candidatus Bathyarchaeota archaeon]MDH5733367.1 undecaprenyl-diphosphate phosphatase [Candidatus Bathyarchaeota archaeon]
MDLIQILILAIIQGITEWLPISSSGHLVLVQQHLGLKDIPLIFDVSLHVGTLCVVVVAFRKDLMNIARALYKLDFESEEGKLALYIAVGSIPTALIGFLFQDFFQFLFTSTLAVGAALIVTGFILYSSKVRKDGRDLGYLDSVLMGIAQGIAIAPGISRSGITLSTGFLRKVKREVVFRYSFLLAIPAVIGATVMESKDLVVGELDPIALLFGVIVSMVVGYISLKLLLKIVFMEKFHLFAYYCWIAGLIVIVFSGF